MQKLNQEVLKDLSIKGEVSGDFEILESNEIGVDEGYDEDLTKELGLDEDSSVFSYTAVDINDETNMYTLEYSHEGVLLTIHDYDEEYVPVTVYKNVV